MNLNDEPRESKEAYERNVKRGEMRSGKGDPNSPKEGVVVNNKTTVIKEPISNNFKRKGIQIVKLKK